MCGKCERIQDEISCLTSQAIPNRFVQKLQLNSIFLKEQVGSKADESHFNIKYLEIQFSNY